MRCKLQVDNLLYACLCLPFLYCVYVIFVHVPSPRLSAYNFLPRKNRVELPDASVWPKDDTDDDRIEMQLTLGYSLAGYLQKHGKTRNNGTKVILLADPGDLFEPHVGGSQTFRENCPVTNCY